MKVKITVKTPKGQSKKCINSFKTQLLGFKAKNKIIEEEIVNDRMFFWVVNCEDDKDYLSLVEKATGGELMIKKFYSVLFKWLSRANALASKFKKGVSWIQKRLIKTLKKNTQHSEEMVKSFESMTKEEFTEFIKVNDKEEMQSLLEGDLIQIKILD